MQHSARLSARLHVTVEVGPSARERLAAVLTRYRPSSVLFLSGPAAGSAGDLAPLVRLAQTHGAAALVGGDAALVRACGADGVHVGPGEDPLAAYRAARAVLGASMIVGAEAGDGRHTAMELGEAGADYLAFAPPARDELAPWWAELFEVPCIALDVGDGPTADRLAAAGVEFIGWRLCADATAAEDAETLGGIVRMLADRDEKV